MQSSRLDDHIYECEYTGMISTNDIEDVIAWFQNVNLPEDRICLDWEEMKVIEPPGKIIPGHKYHIDKDPLAIIEVAGN
jgi:hypothetical protein